MSVLESASASSRTPMRAEEELQDLKVSVFVTEISESEFRLRLAELLHCSWREVEQAGNKTYVLYRSRRDREEEASLHRLRETNFRDLLKLAIRASRMSPDQRDELLRDQAGLSRMLQSPQFSGAMGLVANLPDRAIERLMDGQPCEVSIEGGTGMSSQAARAFIRSQGNGEASGFESGYSRMRFERSDTGADPGLLVVASGTNSERGMRINLPSSRDQIMKMSTRSRERPEYDSARHPRRIEKTISGETFADVLEQVAREFEIDVMAESYQAAHKFPLRQPPGVSTIEKTLDALMMNSQVWWKSGEVYLFQSATWFLDRMNQVPDEEVKRVKERLKRGPLALEEWADLTRLRPQQWMMLQTLRAGSFDGMVQHYEALSLIRTLTEAQQRQLTRPSGLAVGGLNRAQSQAFQSWLRGAGNPDVPLGLRIRAFFQEPLTILRAYSRPPRSREVVLHESAIPAVPRVELPRMTESRSRP